MELKMDAEQSLIPTQNTPFESVIRRLKKEETLLFEKFLIPWCTQVSFPTNPGPVNGSTCVNNVKVAKYRAQLPFLYENVGDRASM